jgi:hypothetical protein
MPTKILILFLSCLSMSALGQQGTVDFNNRVVSPGIDAPITDLGGVKLSGTNYWAQLYAADGLSASRAQLLPVGIPLNFRVGNAAGYFQTSGNNALGQPVSESVAVTSFNGGAASVQIRAWAGLYTSYEAAVAGGAQYGESRILRMDVTGGSLRPPVPLKDASGPVNAFSLGGLPALSISDTVVAEGTNNTVSAIFSVRLFPPSPEIVTVQFNTVDGSALAGEDYASTNGTVTFLPGETNRFLSVSVTGDAAPEPDETFFVQLHDPVHASLAGHSQGTCTITEMQIRSISIDTAVTFNTVMNRSYVLESTDMGTNLWIPVAGATNILGTGGIVTIVDKGSGCAFARLYRARLLQ